MAASGEIEYKKVSSLRFDPENPRLPKSMNTDDESEVVGWMLRDATITELMAAIGEVGYFPGEPLLIAGPEDGDSWVVVEGNRRLTALKLLLDPTIAPRKKKSVERVADEAQYHPEEVPVIRYDDRVEVLNYLGYRHITGVKEWDPIAKARHLSALRDRLDEKDPQKQFKILARLIGSRSDYVQKLLAGLEVHRAIEDAEFFGIPESDDEDPIEFSVLTTAMSYSAIADWLGLDSSATNPTENLDDENVEKLTKWVFGRPSDRKLRESRELGDLAEVVRSERALERLEEGMSLKDAVKLSAAPGKAFRAATRQSRDQLEKARDVQHLVDFFTQQDSEVLHEISRLARLMRSHIEEELLMGVDEAEAGE